MSRRAAKITQADVARALRAAQSAGPSWRVRVATDGSIEIWQDLSPPSTGEAMSARVAPKREIVL